MNSNPSLLTTKQRFLPFINHIFVCVYAIHLHCPVCAVFILLYVDTVLSHDWLQAGTTNTLVGLEELLTPGDDDTASVVSVTSAAQVSESGDEAKLKARLHLSERQLEHLREVSQLYYVDSWV